MCAAVVRGPALGGNSVFHSALESREGVIPLLRQVVKVAARFLERLPVELPHTLATAADAVREPSIGQHFEMLGNPLARDVGAGGESGSRERPV